MDFRMYTVYVLDGIKLGWIPADESPCQSYPSIPMIRRCSTMLPKIIKTVPHEIQLCFTLESPWYFLRMVCHVKVSKFSRLAGRFPIKCPKSNKMECQIWILKQCSKVLACNFFGQVHLQVLQLFVWNWWSQEGGMFLHFLTGPKILKTFRWTQNVKLECLRASHSELTTFSVLRWDNSNCSMYDK